MNESTARALQRADIDFAYRLAAAVGKAGRVQVKTLDLSGVHAFWAGADSPINNAMGDGSRPWPTKDDLIRIEAFFGSGRSILTLSHPSGSLETAHHRYTYNGAIDVMFRRPDPAPPGHGFSISRMATDNEARWSSSVQEGHVGGRGPTVSQRQYFLALPRARDTEAYAVFAGRRIIAAAALTRCGDVALFHADVTLSPHRRRGAQTALIQYRLNRAREGGLKWALASVQPQSASQRNYLRHGFKIAYRQAVFSKNV